jgi:hypothetical protein
VRRRPLTSGGLGGGPDAEDPEIHAGVSTTAASGRTNLSETKTGSFRVAGNPLGIDPSKGPQPKEFEHWLLFALCQRGRCLGWREMSQRNIMCIREEKAGHCKHRHSLA